MYLPTTHQHMTADEFAALPQGPPYFQLVEGELFFMASPTRSHQVLVLNLASSVQAYLDAHPDTGQVFIAPSDVKLDEGNVFEPDIYFVSREREGILTNQGATGAPDMVVEVLSPSTLRLDREKKRAVYFQAGVRELWFVLPERRQVEIHLSVPSGETIRTLSTGDVLMTEIIPGWSMLLEALFARVTLS